MTRIAIDRSTPDNKPHDSNRPASLETPKIPKFKKKP